MSSRVLFLRRDCAGGAGPVVDAPSDGVGAGADVDGAADVDVVAPCAEPVVVFASVGFAPPKREGFGADDVAPEGGFDTDADELVVLALPKRRVGAGAEEVGAAVPLV
jgi:hypothetical protein